MPSDALAAYLGVARILRRAGRRQRSIALEADGHHLMPDVWTSAGVLTGIGLVALTGYGQDEDRRKAMEAGFERAWSSIRTMTASQSAHGCSSSSGSPHASRSRSEYARRDHTFTRSRLVLMSSLRLRCVGSGFVE